MRKVYENNIFVVNIPPEVDEVQLRKVFEEKPGDIISYKIKEILRKDKPEKSVI
jgi:RNA recognition motif-containing protein